MLLKSIKIKEGYSLQEMGGEFHMFNLADKNGGSVTGTNSFNELGLFLWNKIEEGMSCEDMIKETMIRNDSDYEDAEMDVGEFLAKLINAGAIEYEK